MTANRSEPPLAVEASAVAEAVLRGLEKDAEIVWVPPQLRYLLGILRFAPRSLWRRIPN